MMKWPVFSLLLLAGATAAAQQPMDIAGVAVSGDGKLIAAAGSAEEAGLIRILEPGGKLVRDIPAPGSGLEPALSADGRLLAVSLRGREPGDLKGYLGVWEVASGKELAHAVPFQGQLMALAFAPDGARIAVAGERELVVVDTAGKPQAALALHAPPARMAWSYDGKWLVYGSANLYVWQVGTPQAIKTDALPGANRAFILPDGKTVLALASGSGAALFDVVTQQTKPFQLPGMFNDAGVSPDGKWLVTQGNHELFWFSLPDATPRASWDLEYNIRSFSYSPDGKFVVATHRSGDMRSTWMRVLTAGAKGEMVTLAEIGVPGKEPAGAASEPVAAPAGGLTDVPPGLSQLASDVAVMTGGVSDGAFPEKLGFGNTYSSEEELSQRCDRVVNAAFAGGLPGTAKIAASYNARVPGLVKDPDGVSRSILSLADVKKVLCGRMREVYLTAKMASAAYSAGQSLYFAKQDKSIGPAFNMYQDEWARCSKVVAEVRTEGLSDQAPIPYNNQGLAELPTPVTFGEIDERVCRAAQHAGGAITQALRAAEEAKYAPYLAVLSGDRKRIFREANVLGGTSWYGPGGKRLESPADFKNARAWYYYVHDRNVWPERWGVRGHVFNGDSRGGGYSKDGVGNSPPASAYP